MAPRAPQRLPASLPGHVHGCWSCELRPWPSLGTPCLARGARACSWWQAAPASLSLPALSLDPPSRQPVRGPSHLVRLHGAGQHRPWCETSLLDTAPSLVCGGPVGTAPGTALAERPQPLAPSSVPGEGTAGGCRSRCCAGGGTGRGVPVPVPASAPAASWALGWRRGFVSFPARHRPAAPAEPGTHPGSCCAPTAARSSSWSRCGVQPGLGQAQEQVPQGWHRPCRAPRPQARDLQVFPRSTSCQR